MLDFPSEFLWSLGVGAIVILLFSYDQLNRPSYREAQKLSRLLELLQPADIRSASVFLRMYLFYTALLLGIYVATSLSGGLVLGFMFTEVVSDGVPIPEAAEGAVEVAWDARVPLIVSLMMVGLMPNANGMIFNALERRIRLLAHRFFGIPDSLFHRCDALVHARLVEESIDEHTREAPAMVRMHAWTAAAEASLGGAERFEAAQLRGALLKLSAFSVWVLDGDGWPSHVVRMRFSRLEDDLRYRITELGNTLDILCTAQQALDADDGDPHHVAVMLGIDPSNSGSVDALVSRLRVHIRDRWAWAIEPAREISRDACALMMLYLEQEQALPDDEPGSVPLAAWIRAARRNIQANSRELDIIVGAGVAVVLTMMIGGAGARLIGWASQEYTVLEVALQYALMTCATYIPAMLLAVSIRGSLRDRGEWPPLYSDDPERIARHTGILVRGALVALPFVIVARLMCIAASPDVGFEDIAGRLPEMALEALQIEWPRALIGALQGVLTVVALDAAAASGLDGKGGRWLERLPVVHGTLFLLLGLGAAAHASDVTVGTISPASIAYQGALVALIGAATSLVLARSRNIGVVT